MNIYSFVFLFQMVQAIQVLRFHLLELEKVSEIFAISLKLCYYYFIARYIVTFENNIAGLFNFLIFSSFKYRLI